MKCVVIPRATTKRSRLSEWLKKTEHTYKRYNLNKTG